MLRSIIFCKMSKDKGIRTDIMRPPVLSENEPVVKFELRTAASRI